MKINKNINLEDTWKTWKVYSESSKKSSHFIIKDDANKQHKHDLVCFGRCPFTTCTDSYTGETATRLSECVVDHAGTDMESHIAKHCWNSDHEMVNIENFEIFNMGCNNYTYWRRISKALCGKWYCPSLNAKDNPVSLQGKFWTLLAVAVFKY